MIIPIIIFSMYSLTAQRHRDILEKLKSRT